MNYETLIHECESFLRAGQLQRSHRLLALVKPAHVPREHRRTLATLCRRSNLLSTGLKLLSPVVRGSQKHAFGPPQPAEMAEYGALLYRMGAIAEAVRLLESVDCREAPEALLYQAFCYFNHWEYEAALPVLEMYLRAPLSRYASTVGCVNICAALVGTKRFSAARKLIDANLAITKHEGLVRLQGNCLELSAQVYLHQGLFAKARHELDAAALLFKDDKSSDQLYTRKWKAVLEGFESGSPAPILEFAQEARARQEWESVRDADLFALKVKYDEKRFHHLLFGTPFLPYRERVIQELGRKPSHASFTLGEEGGTVLDLRSGEVNAGSPFKPATAVHRVVEALSRDFYRPLSLGGLFSQLFTGEYFDIYSSPSRVHQLLRRTRRWLEENNLPVKIEGQSAGYRLKVEGAFAVRVPFERNVLTHNRLQWEQLVECLRKDKFFTAQQGRSALNLPPSSFKRLIRWAVENSLVIKRGGGSNVIYRFAENRPAPEERAAA